jgi:hypothetical protein
MSGFPVGELRAPRHRRRHVWPPVHEMYGTPLPLPCAGVSAGRLPIRLGRRFRLRTSPTGQTGRTPSSAIRPSPRPAPSHPIDTPPFRASEFGDYFVTIVTIHYNCLSCENLLSGISIQSEEILVFQSGPLSSVQPPPSSPFPPASSDGARHLNAAAPAAPAPDYAASRAVLARQNETNLQLSKEQLDFLHLVELNEVSATITEICEFTGVSRPTFYRWRSNPRFSQAFGECIARCVFNDLSIVLRNELQDAMTGDRKAGRHTLRLFLSGRGLYHYDAILAMLSWAGRNTLIPPTAGSPNGDADPHPPAPAPAQPNSSSAAPSAPAPAASWPPAAPPTPAAACAGTSVPTAGAANSAFAAACAKSLEAPNPPANETFSSPEINRPQGCQPLLRQRLSDAVGREVAFGVSHTPAAAGCDSKAAREPLRAAPGSAGPATSAFTKGLEVADGADSKDGPNSRENETFVSSTTFRAENLQVTRNTPLTTTAAPSVAPKCRIACLTSFALRRARRPRRGRDAARSPSCASSPPRSPYATPATPVALPSHGVPLPTVARVIASACRQTRLAPEWRRPRGCSRSCRGSRRDDFYIRTCRVDAGAKPPPARRSR